jgi:hypothetical protein
MLAIIEEALQNGQFRETGNIDEEKQNKNMCWTPLCANKQKYR